MKLAVTWCVLAKSVFGGVVRIEGRQALFLVNLPPRRMAGEVSEGMLFDIGFADGVTPVLAVPEQPVPNGTRAG